MKYEIALRTIGLFSGVYFTLGWGEKSPPGWDVPLMVGVIVLAMTLRYFD